MPRKPTRPATLLAEPDVRRWHENLARGSPATADVNLRRLAAFCDSVGVSPDGLLKLDPKDLHDRFLDFVAAEQKRGVAGSYIVRSVKGAKSWLLHNGITLTRPIKVHGAKETPRLTEERVPTQDELRKIFLAGTPRIRTACALVAFSGLRPEVLGNYTGDDGLVLGDFPELKITKDSVEFDIVPALVRVRSSLSKNSNGYLTFLSEEGCSYLAQYLEERLRAGEKLTLESDLIHPDRAGKRFIRTVNIGDAVRTAVRGAGFPWRPYVLRHYFDTQLLTAESKGKVPHDFRVYWMGHTGSIDARYTTNKRHVPKEFLEEMRAAYKRCEPFLSSIPTRSELDAGVLKVVKALLIARGMPEDEAQNLDLSEKSEPELAEIFKRLGTAPVRPVQRAVAISEVPGLLAKGWEFVSGLDGGHAVLRAPLQPSADGFRI